VVDSGELDSKLDLEVVIETEMEMEIGVEIVAMVGAEAHDKRATHVMDVDLRQIDGDAGVAVSLAVDEV
jgi:hypothetical protein